jgi:hypothetical protein
MKKDRICFFDAMRVDYDKKRRFTATSIGVATN